VGTQHPFIVAQTVDVLEFSLKDLIPLVGGFVQTSGSLGNIVHEITVPAGFTTLEVHTSGAPYGNGQLLINGQAYAAPTATATSYVVEPGVVRIGYSFSSESYLPLNSLVLHRPEASRNDSLIARVGGNGTGNDNYDGGAGLDTLVYTSAERGLTINLAAGTAVGSEIGSDRLLNIENVSGGSGADMMIGNALQNVLKGNGGNDVLKMSAGKDRLYGDGGIDTVTYAGLAGVTVNLTQGADSMGSRLFGVENVIGTSFNDIVVGDGSNNVFFASGGKDKYYGEAGLDLVSYVGLSSGVIVNLVQGADSIGSRLFGIENVLGSAFKDTFVGDARANAFYGGAGNDYLDAGAGNDYLDGGFGNDRLVGGAGGDTFVFALNFGADTVADFTPGTDRLEFSGSVFADFSAMLAWTTQVGTSAVISYDPNNTLTLSNVLVSSLSAENFAFI
jgi:serralysin